MEHHEPGWDDLIALNLRQPHASRDLACFPDPAALADAERADAEAFRLT